MSDNPPLFDVCLDEDIQLIQYGETAVLIYFKQSIDLQINQQVLALNHWLDHEPLHGILEKIPAYASLLVYYDPALVTLSDVIRWIKSRLSSMPTDLSTAVSRLIKVPVYYGGEVGLDLEVVAQLHSLTPSDVIDIHCGAEYTVAMMGFTPGFVYLLGMDNRLATPRKASPRTHVPAGAIGIAGSQTGIYSIDSPGGWQIIGWSPLPLFIPGSQSPFYFSPGDRIKFEPVSGKEA